MITLSYQDYKALERTKGTDATRTYLDGWCVYHVHENDVVLISTDGKQLSRLTVKLDDSFQALKELEKKILEPPNTKLKKSDTLTIKKVNDKWFYVVTSARGAETTEEVRFIEGKYPCIENVWPTEKTAVLETAINGRYVLDEEFNLTIHGDGKFIMLPFANEPDKKSKLEVLFMGVDPDRKGKVVKIQETGKEATRLKNRITELEEELKTQAEKSKEIEPVQPPTAIKGLSEELAESISKVPTYARKEYQKAVDMILHFSKAA